MIGQDVLVRGWLVVGVIGVGLGSLAACTDDSGNAGSTSSTTAAPPPSAKPETTLCTEVERQGELRAEDVTDAEAIAALVAELPEERRTDAALFYYPYGGDIPDGVDTSGSAAAEAGGRLSALYREQCGYEGP